MGPSLNPKPGGRVERNPKSGSGNGSVALHNSVSKETSTLKPLEPRRPESQAAPNPSQHQVIMEQAFDRPKSQEPQT